MCMCLLRKYNIRSFNKRYELGEEIGQGSHAVVRLCMDKATGETFACKILKEDSYSTEEAKILKVVSGHPNIVTYQADYGGDYLVMEYYKGDNLYKQKTIYTEHQAANILMSLMRAIQFCHSKGIVHRDITAKNILLADKNDPASVKLVDFGLATRLPSKGHLHDVVGIPYYMAPELINERYGKEVDVWSCGVVLYWMLSGNLPFNQKTFEDMSEAIQTSDRSLKFPHKKWKHVSVDGKNLIRGMLERDPRKRLTPEQVMNHQWIRILIGDSSCQGQ